MTDEPITYTAADLAEEFNTDPKSFRSWLRSLTDTRAGRGGKWIFTEEDADALREAWANRGHKKATRPTFAQPADDA